MAQTTTALPSGRSVVSFSTDGSTWTDQSGAIADVTHSGGDQMVGSQHTQGDDYAVVVASGKKDPIETTIKAVWTVTSNEAWDRLWTIWDAAGPSTMYFKYSPQGGQSGDIEYITAISAGTAAAAAIKSLRVPDVQDNGEIIAFECVLTTPRYIDATIA